MSRPSTQAQPGHAPSRFGALREFLRGESAGGAMLMLSAVVALVWANSPGVHGYEALLHWTPPVRPALPLHAWINDAVMVVFFLLVGLELRREMTCGELNTTRRLAAPGLAALGGMLVPAAIFFLFNRHDPSAMRGWAVPVATDIAFALAVISILGKRVPVQLKVFLTALAIMDDLGAILIIAAFYAKGLDLWSLAGSVVVLGALWGVRRLGVRRLLPFLLGGVALWALVFRSGIHPTLAGVALAFVIPAGERPGESRAPAERLEHGLHPWVAFLVLPVFGLANAGLSFGSLPPGAVTDRLTLGVALGLVVGKQLGVFGALAAAKWAGLAQLPAGINKTQLYGASILCGIGFTMSLFIGEIAFRGGPRADEIKLAVFAASLLSGVAGLLVLALARRTGGGGKGYRS